jgi:transposase
LLLSLKSLYARTTGQTLAQSEAKALDQEDLAQLFPPPANQLVAGEQVSLMGHLDQSIKLLEQAVEHVADKLPCYEKLPTLPGIGRILALIVSMETGPISRFATAGQYASYCRCVQAERESNGKSKGENNRKCGNKYLAWAWVEAAHFARRSDAACRKFYERKKAQTNTRVATKALACKLAKAAWHVMHDQVSYDPGRVFPWLAQSPAGKTA